MEAEEKEEEEEREVSEVDGVTFRTNCASQNNNVVKASSLMITPPPPPLPPPPRRVDIKISLLGILTHFFNGQIVPYPGTTHSDKGSTPLPAEPTHTPWIRFTCSLVNLQEGRDLLVKRGFRGRGDG